MTPITPRLSVSGPDSDGDYELMLEANVLADYTYLSRAEADALIVALGGRSRLTCTCDSGLGDDPHKRHCALYPAPPSTDPATGAL